MYALVGRAGSSWLINDITRVGENSGQGGAVVAVVRIHVAEAVKAPSRRIRIGRAIDITTEGLQGSGVGVIGSAASSPCDKMK